MTSARSSTDTDGSVRPSSQGGENVPAPMPPDRGIVSSSPSASAGHAGVNSGLLTDSQVEDAFRQFTAGSRASRVFDARQARVTMINWTDEPVRAAMDDDFFNARSAGSLRSSDRGRNVRRSEIRQRPSAATGRPCQTAFPSGAALFSHPQGCPSQMTGTEAEIAVTHAGDVSDAGESQDTNTSSPTLARPYRYPPSCFVSSTNAVRLRADWGSQQMDFEIPSHQIVALSTNKLLHRRTATGRDGTAQVEYALYTLYSRPEPEEADRIVRKDGTVVEVDADLRVSKDHVRMSLQEEARRVRVLARNGEEGRWMNLRRLTSVMRRGDE